MLRNMVVAAVASASMAMPALAADVAPAPIAPTSMAITWTGLYIGANGGWGWSNYTLSDAPFGKTGIADIALARSFSNPTTGGVFGGQLGFNWQLGQNWLIGIEGDYDGAGINGAAGTVFPLRAPKGSSDSFSVSENISQLATFRGRFGFVWGLTPSVPAYFRQSGLLYVTAGGAWENLSANTTISANTGAMLFGEAATAGYSMTRSGFVGGGGVELMTAPNWTVRAEYLYYGFGGSNNERLALTNCAIPGCGVTLVASNNNISVFRLGANYRFDWIR